MFDPLAIARALTASDIDSEQADAIEDAPCQGPRARSARHRQPRRPLPSASRSAQWRAVPSRDTASCIPRKK